MSRLHYFLLSAASSLIALIVSPLSAQAQVSLVSQATDGTRATAASAGPVVSANGDVVAFASDANTLVALDGNGQTDVFVRARSLNQTTRVSVATGGVEANGTSLEAALSADGRFVAFASNASNLVASDLNTLWDVFLHDRQTGETSRVSVATGGTEGNGDSREPAISADGRWVAFRSAANNLVATDANAVADIFVRDLQTGVTTRVSFGTGGVEANGISQSPTISGNGRYTAFVSFASNIVGNDINAVCDTNADGIAAENCPDIFVYDRDTGNVSRASVSTQGAEAAGASSGPAISDDGRTLAFTSTAPNLVTGDANNVADVFVRDLAFGFTTRASLATGRIESNGASGAARVSGDGRFVSFESDATSFYQVDGNGKTDVFVHDRLIAHTVRVSTANVAGDDMDSTGRSISAALSSDGRTVVFVSDGPEFAPPDINGLADVFARSLDSDGDGMTNDWESTFGLDPANPADAALDPDHDTVTSLQEFQLGTHPMGFFRRYFAEGATGPFFDTRLALANADPLGNYNAIVRFQRSDGVEFKYFLGVPAYRRTTLDPETIPGLADAEFATLIESDGHLISDRTMTWDQTGYGSHAESSVIEPRREWFLAEGSTVGDFDLFYLLQNADPTLPANVTVRYLLPSGTFLDQNYVVPPSSRFNIWVDKVPGLENTDVSARFLIDASDPPIIVERAMYLSGGGQVFRAGHESAAIYRTDLNWLFAEGATGPFFDLFILIANPTSQTADIEATFLKPDGTTDVRTYQVPPTSRFNIWVDLIPGLEATAVATKLRSTNGVEFVAERAMWWPGTSATWHEAHNSPGSRLVDTKWALGDGEVGGANSTETYILLANISQTTVATVRVTVLFEDAAPVMKDFLVAPNSRFNVSVKDEFPEALNKRFGAVIESLGTPAPYLVVERAMYSNSGDVVWAAGTNALATRLSETPIPVP